MGVKSGSKARGRLARRLDGWQPGLVAVLVAWATALLVVPRAVPPVDVPEPVVTPAEIAALRAREGGLAQRARGSLSPAVRALGSAIRRVGAAEAAREPAALGAAHHEVASAIRAVPRTAFEEVLALRAYQAESFVAALRAWEQTGVATDDVAELGGALLDVLAPPCDGGRRRVVMDDDEIGAAFRKRWGKVVRAGEGDLQPSLLEERMLFAFSLRHPRADLGGGDPRTASAVAAQALLRRIEQHGRADPDYPTEFARGVALYRAGQYARAVQAFDRHLRLRPDGPLTARAQNHARAAMAAELGDPPGASWL